VQALPPLVTDTAALWPAYGHFLAALKRYDWTACRAVLDAVSPVERTRLIRSGADEPGLEEWLRGVIRHDPRDGAAFALLGHHLTVVGWNIRSTSLAKDVSREQWQGFTEWLNKAEQVMIEGCARNPDDPAIWTVRLTSARGISLGIDEETRRYNRVAAIDEHHLPAQGDHLEQLYPKWGGSWEKAHGFARERMLAVPPGAPHGRLVAQAIVEHIVWTDDKEKTAYMDKARPELNEAAQRSIGHPSFVPGTYEADLTLGSFAFAFWVYDDIRSTANVFRQMGQRAALGPWNDASDKLFAAREWAFKGEQWYA
jgi:hypothetical protein